MVEASFIKANSNPRKDADTQSNIDAEWGYKGFGDSATVNADRKLKPLTLSVKANLKIFETE